MADSSATFSVEIEETGGDDAASQLEALRAKIVADTAALREMKAAMNNLKGGTSVNISAFKELQDKIAAQKASIAESQSSYVSLGGTFNKVEKATEGAAASTGSSISSLAALGKAAKLGGGELGSMGGTAGKLVRILGKTGIAGVAVLAAVALVALAVVAVKTAIEIAKWAVGLADANRNAALTTQGIEKSSVALKGLGKILPGIQDATGLATDELQKMAEGLDAAGVSAKDMPAALKALATATAGGATAEFLTKLKTQLAQGGEAAKKAAADVQASFGGIVAKKLLSLDAQAEKFHRNISAIFGGLNIEGFLSGLSKLVALFDANTASGKALKFLFEALFQPLIDGAVAAIPKVVSFLKSVEIVALKVYIALLQFSKTRFFAALMIGLKAIAVVLGVIAAIALVGLALMALPFIVAAAAVVALIAVFGTIIDAFSQLPELASAAWNAIAGAASDAWNAVKGAVQSALDWLTSIDLGSVGSAIIDGLVGGIKAAGGAVLSALTGIVGGAIDGVKSLLGIHSPSTVFKKMGGHTAEGFADGIDAGSGGVESAAGDMAGAAVGGAGSAPSRGGSGASIVIEAGAIVIHVDDAKKINGPAFMADLADALEMVVLERGGLAA
jgi:hypothetical protein